MRRLLRAVWKVLRALVLYLWAVARENAYFWLMVALGFVLGVAFWEVAT